MQDYLTFDTTVEPMQWGSAVYTIVRLPPGVARALGSAKRVEGEFADHPVNLAVTKAPVINDPFLYAGKSLLDRTKITPGEPFEARLRPVDPTVVDVPTDVTNALKSAGKTALWEGLTPGKKRGFLHQINSAKRAETRLKRISRMLSDLT